MDDDLNQQITTTVQKAKYSETMARLRLDPSAVLQRIEMYLSGKTIKVVSDENGNLKETMIQFKQPYMNDEGIYSTLFWIEGQLNTQTVQGNFLTAQDWREFMADFRTNIAVHILTNLYKYAYNDDVELLEKNFRGIIDQISDTIDRHSSRQIFNKERESYADTMVSKESNTMEKSRGLGLFNRKINA